MNSPVKKQVTIDANGKVKSNKHQEQYRRPATLLQRLSSPGFSFGSPASATKASTKKQVSKTGNFDFNDSFSDKLSVVDLKSPSPTRRLSTASSMSKISTMSSYKSSFGGSQVSGTSLGSNSNIPFAQRRAKSEVAALDALKKAKQVRNSIAIIIIYLYCVNFSWLESISTKLKGMRKT